MSIDILLGSRNGTSGWIWNHCFTLFEVDPPQISRLVVSVAVEVPVLETIWGFVDPAVSVVGFIRWAPRQMPIRRKPSLMIPTLVILHLVASGVALLSGGLALALTGRGTGSVVGWSGLLYVGSVGVMGASSMGLFRETGGWHALHGVALLLIVIVSPAGWAMVRRPGDPTPCLRYRRALSGTYLVLLVSTVLETARRLVAPILAARGFEAWETYWIAVGLLTASVALIGLQLVRNRILDPTAEGTSIRGAKPRREGAAEK